MSKYYKLIILPEAQKDIRDIIIYIVKELEAPKAALNLQETFKKTIDSLKEKPKRIRLIDEQPWKNIGVRKTRVKNYYIYFLVDDLELTVKILAIIYIGRDQKRQLSKRL